MARPVNGRLDDAALALLGHLNLMEFCREGTRWEPKGVVHEEGGALLLASVSPFPVMVNAAFRTDDEIDAGAVVATAVEFFAQRQRGFTLFVRDLAGVDDDLARAAESAGLTELFRAPEMICRQRLDERPAPAGAELRRVTQEAEARDFAKVNAQAYTSLGMPADVVNALFSHPRALLAPHVMAVVAYLEGQPVSAAMTVVSHGIAGVYWVGTVEAARGTGLGEACTRAVTNAGFDLGARAQSLQASPMGAPIYTRMGYETLYEYRHFVKWE
jgi:hypothetical protein